ncbi:type III-D CRISPR-associated RAMP protein Csx10 [Thermoflexus hugenholtzii]|jgi:CRISPR-associated RAMP protein, Csx10 family|uniref:CRISPR-associated protein Csx10 n=1 Tax=Thermoflexus hugenholtzii JAD2 TaxID=877466 RepID=A0A212RMP0_9CHLR|nr:CRISPR-associated RAMP protein Csx10 [Thermoflexus hugenholtzii]SNB73735.1 CRISPR-associated protein Csx10 [Thermoflexus hugenholtzii JAD2]
MTEYFVCLTPEKPLRTGTLKPRGDYLDTRDYLPGSVLRGALAEWLKLEGKASQIVPTVQKVRFGNFFPSVAESVWALPFPMTALECKLHGGFRRIPRGSTEKPGHGIRDSLLIALAYAELERQGVRFPVPMLLRCTHENKGEKCGGRMERVSGFYAALPEGWRAMKIEKALQTKVALSRHRRAAQEGMLYRVIGVRPKGTFVGRIWVEDEAILEELKKAVESVGVGALTTRGFGAARLKAVEPGIEPIAERLRTFNEKLREVWRDLADLAQQTGSPVPTEPSGTYFSVDLLSPAVLRDPHGLPTLKLFLKLDGQWREPIFWATQHTFVGGFSTAWGLPKPTYLGAAMGSVYVFRTEASQEELLPFLEDLEARGVGIRTDEGLGEILVCHPFHQEVMPV